MLRTVFDCKLSWNLSSSYRHRLVVNASSHFYCAINWDRLWNVKTIKINFLFISFVWMLRFHINADSYYTNHILMYKFQIKLRFEHVIFFFDETCRAHHLLCPNACMICPFCSVLTIIWKLTFHCSRIQFITRNCLNRPIKNHIHSILFAFNTLSKCTIFLFGSIVARSPSTEFVYFCTCYVILFTPNSTDRIINSAQNGKKKTGSSHMTSHCNVYLLIKEWNENDVNKRKQHIQIKTNCAIFLWLSQHINTW